MAVTTHNNTATAYNGTLVTLAAQKYVKQFMKRDKDKFNESLDDTVTGVHVRVTGGVPGSPYEVKGKEKLYDDYVKYFFSVASNLDLRYANCRAVGLHAYIEYEADEDTVDDNGVKGRYLVHTNTELQFKKKEDSLKIVNIWETTSKVLL